MSSADSKDPDASPVRNRDPEGKHVYTIGHSNHSLEAFFALLKQYSIEVIVDVRSSPYTKYSTHFNQSNLKLSLSDRGLKYLYLGRELGGIPKNDQYYDEDGHVLYWKIADSEVFKEAIERLCRGINMYTVALLCGEENPSGCHRRLLLGKVLEKRGISTLHIRASGNLENEDDLAEQEAAPVTQLSLYEFNNKNKSQTEWKSAHSVLKK